MTPKDKEELLFTIENVFECAISEKIFLGLERSKKAKDRILQLIERDTSKRITVDHDGEFSEAYCPNCHEFLDTACIGDFCIECGQRLDWGE